MELTPGARLGPYEIVARIGEGGMGQVWKARDTRLDRIVAIKTSLAKFSERFEREARAVAALNHPHICTLYDVGPDYLVMEFVEGSEVKGPLPLDQALKYAIQFAGALEAAHRKLVTHRDLKPANILITKAGVKVLDFGLAQLGKAEPLGTITENDATLTRALTQEGSIVGTLQYMAPEQLQGKPVDVRADIFSFGCVLYEMLTGKRAFGGSSTASVIAAILERPAPSVGEVAPASLDWVLGRCLAKEPDERWQTARDLRAELERCALSAAETREAHPARHVPLLAWATAGVLAVIAGAVSFIHLRETAPVAAAIQFSIPSPDHSTFRSWAELSPDGKFLAYDTSKDGILTIWLRPLDSQQARPLVTELGAEGSMLSLGYVFWSPDGHWIGYSHGGKLKKVDVTAASPAALVICDCISGFRGGAWGRDGTILFSPNPTSPIMRVSATGGTAVPATTLDARNELLHRFPTFLPDGRHFLYYVGSYDAAHSGVYVGDLQTTGPGRRVLDADSHAVFVPRSPGNSAGHLLFVKDATLRAVSFDSGRLEVTGEPTVVAQNVDQVNSHGGFSASATGIVSFWPGDPFPPQNLAWYGRDGKLQEAIPGADSLMRGSLDGVSLSQDGQYLAMGLGRTLGGKNNRILLFDLPRGSSQQLVTGKNSGIMPVWAADAKRLAFGYSDAGALNVYLQAPGQPNTLEHLVSTATQAWPTDWSLDGNLLLYVVDNSGQFDLRALTMQDKKAHVWLKSPDSATQAQLAPGAMNPWWVAYVSTESGHSEVYLESFTLEGQRAGRIQVSTNGGTDPRWRGDGRELYYLSTDSKIMVVDVTSGFTAGAPKELFKPPALAGSSIYRPHRYAVTRDGKRFVLATAPVEQDVTPLSVIVNWQEQLHH